MCILYGALRATKSLRRYKIIKKVKLNDQVAIGMAVEAEDIIVESKDWNKMMKEFSEAMLDNYMNQ